MRVIPTGSVQAGQKRVRKAATRRNWTLLNGRHTIEPGCLRLQKAVPVERSSLIRQVVCDCDLDRIAPICFDRWPGYLAVDHDDTSIEAVRSFEASFENEIISTGHPCWCALVVRVGIIRGLRTPWWLGRPDNQRNSLRRLITYNGVRA